VKRGKGKAIPAAPYPSSSHASGISILRPFFFSVLLFLCVSCATPLLRPPSAELERLWQAHAATLTPVSYWELRGRLAVRTDDRGGQASIMWQREDLRHQIRLNGPFGSGAVRVVQDQDGARLTDSQSRVFEAGDAEQLVALYTGWQLPLGHLNWWVRGLPVPGMHARRELDDSGRLKTLRQQDWEVQYQEYTRVDQRDLPNRLTLTRAATPSAPALEARFVIDRWAQVK
jgi:outer membrane lipoprotein LolB